MRSRVVSSRRVLGGMAAVALCAVLVPAVSTTSIAGAADCKVGAEATGCKLPDGARFYKKLPANASITVQVGGKGVSISAYAAAIKCAKFDPSQGDEAWVAVGIAGTQHPKVGKSYLLKESDPDRLAFALSGVVSGEAALPRRLTALVLDHVRASENRHRLSLRMPRGVHLTDREWDVLELMHDELTTTDVAAQLSISPVTVRRHLSSAVAKLGVGDRDAALALVRDLNLAGAGRDDDVRVDASG